MQQFSFPRIAFAIFLLTAALVAVPVHGRTKPYPGMPETLPAGRNISVSDPAESILEALQERRRQGDGEKTAQRLGAFRQRAVIRAPDAVSQRIARWHTAVKERARELPKKIIAYRIERLHARFSRVLAALERQRERIQAHLDQLSSAGQDVTEPHAFLKKAGDAIGEARRAVAAFPALARESAGLEERAATVEAVHAATRETKKMLQTAHEALRAVLTSLKRDRAGAAR